MRTKRASLIESFIVCFVTLAFALFVATARSQVGSGSISGRVTEVSGAVIPNAQVTIRDVGTGASYTLMTSSEGRYSAPNLEVGTYDVKVEMRGFAAKVNAGLNLSVGDNAEVDFQLQLGSVNQVVTVEADITQVETTSSEVGTLVGEQQMHDLPLNGRDFDQLSGLAPGVNQVAGQNQSPGGLFGSGVSFSFSGLRPEGQVILLDGANINGYWDRGSGSTMAGTSMGVDAIGEFQSLSSNYSAQIGGYGAAVNSITRSGTNSFHGSAYDFQEKF